MTALRKIHTKLFSVLAIILAIGLAFWQYKLVADAKTPSLFPNESSDSETMLEFTMNSGRAVSIPSDTTQYSVVVFWNTASQRSMSLIKEVTEFYVEAEFDSVLDFYLINLNDDPEKMRQLVDFDDLDIPFGYAPKGQLLQEYSIRSVPFTVLLGPDGKVITYTEGYEAGALKLQLSRLVAGQGMLRRSGEFKFEIN